MKKSVLIVDDSEDVRWTLRKVLENAGMGVIDAPDGETALGMIPQLHPDVMLLDVKMPGMDGHEVLRKIRQLNVRLPIIILTAYGDIKDAVKAMKAGAFDYMTKPFNNEEVIITVRMALNESRSSDTSPFASSTEGGRSMQEIMGRSEKIRALEMEVARVAPTDFSVLIIGETGSGKEIVARAIHAQSRRRSAPFIGIDAGALSDNLFESEFFGYEKGAFTGAETTMPGKLDAAADGTLFLDEISNLPPSMQSKLLRVLQERQFFHIGGVKTIKANVRLICATNIDIELRANALSFRRDLFYRVSEDIIHVPSLRERKEDIEFLAGWFLTRINVELGKSVTGFSEASIQLMLEYDWPGNVRELRNLIIKAALIADRTIEVEHLGLLHDRQVGRAGAGHEDFDRSSPVPLRETLHRNLATMEKKIIADALRQTGGNSAKAARMLKVDYKTIYTKVKKYRLKTN